MRPLFRIRDLDLAYLDTLRKLWRAANGIEGMLLEGSLAGLATPPQ